MSIQNPRVGRGVQLEEVATAADAVLAQGERPTIERVRAQLGRGSPNTVGPMLDVWYASLARRLLPEGEIDGALGQGAGTAAALPAPVLRAAKALWGRAQQHAHEQAGDALRLEREALEQHRGQLAAERQALETDQQRLHERAEALTAALGAKDDQLGHLGRQLSDLQQTLAGRDTEMASLHAARAAMAQSLQTERERLRELAEGHRQERERLEQRATAHEKRLLEDVDRARQDVKRLSQQLADDNKKAAKALLEAQEQVQAQRLQVSVLGTENVGLARELAAAREEIKVVKLQQEQSRQDTAQLLMELNARLSREADTAAKPRAGAAIKPATRKSPTQAKSKPPATR